jgi:hypothetical protein
MLAMVVGSACAPTTTFDQVWTSPVAQTEAPLERVVTVFISDNTTMRHSGEDRLAVELAQKGVQATPAYRIFGDGATDMKDLESMKTRLRSMGYDGIVTMRIVEREEDIEAVPSTFDGYWGYWGYGYWGGPMYSPGYLYTETIYRLETAAYSLKTGALVWSALTKTVDPESAHDLVNETTEVVAGQLARQGLAG